MWGKITRIFFKTFAILFLSMFVFGVLLYFVAQTYAFQTWLGKRASSYLSSKMNNKIDVNKVHLDFFSKATLNGVTILDKQQDTLLHGDISVDIRNFSYKQQHLVLHKITLTDVTAKLIRYKNDSTFNYQFLIDYFDSGKKDTTKKQGWDIKFGDVLLNRVNFVYRIQKYVSPVTNNINFDDLVLKHTSGKISNIAIDGQDVRFSVSHLKTKEQSGFELNNLTSTVSICNDRLTCENLRLETPRSMIKGKLDFSFSAWDDFDDFINKVKIDSYLADSTCVHSDDIAAFTSELNGLSKKIFLSGEVEGSVNDLKLNNFNFSYGSGTRFIGNITLTGLPDIESSYLHFDAKELSSNYFDISNTPEYPFAAGKKMVVPAELKNLGTPVYRGKFDGFVNDFTTYGKFKSALGDITAKLSVQIGDKNDDVSYQGDIRTDNFNLGKLIAQGDLRELTVNAKINGKGTTLKNLDANFDAEITKLSYNGYNYNSISLNGKIKEKLFTGKLLSKDPNADFDFNGTVNFNNTVPEMDFISTINNLQLNTLKLMNSKDSASISSQIFIRIQGNSIDRLSGQINFDNTIYKAGGKEFKLSSFNIDMDQGREDKKIKLSSEYVNAAIKGHYELTNLKPAFEGLLYNYYPTFFVKPVTAKKYSDELTFKIRIKKFSTIKTLFLPDLMISPETMIEGNFSATENKMNVQMNASKLSYKSISVNDFGLILNENKNTVLAEISGKTLKLQDSTLIENFDFNTTSKDRDSKFVFDWNNLKTPANTGSLKGQVSFNNTGAFLTCEQLLVSVNDSTWKLSSASTIRIAKNGNISLDPLEVSNNGQKISVSGTLSEEEGDSLLINTSELILSQFNPLLKLATVNLQGVMDAHIVLSNTNKNFVFSGNLGLRQLKLNDNLIGELKVMTGYNTKEKFITLNGFTSLGLQDEFGNAVKNISFGGNYYLDNRPETIDIDFSAKPANLKLLNPLLTDIITINNAFVNGEGKIHGTTDKIKIDGKFKLFNGEIKVDYTNVTYNITGDIDVMPDQIRFSDLLMREKGSKAAPQGTVNGNLFHDNFNKVQLDYDITYKKMLVLNTSEKQNNLYYGKIYGTGNAGIYGFTNNLFMQIIDTTTKNSKFYLPLDGPAEISENNFVHFIKKDTFTIRKPVHTPSGFNLKMLVHATPEAQAQIILDKKTGDVLNAQGKGDLRLELNTQGKFEMFGDYMITNGNYLFTLENVVNKKFEIDPGSKVSWAGDPTNAEIDITTSYKQRASIAPLLNDTTKGRFPVDCKLKFTGKLFSPNIKFAIEFPNLDATFKAKIDNVLSDEAELNRQVFSFLLLRSFVTPLIYKTTGGVTAGGAAASTGSELLSNRLSDFLNTYFGNLTGIRDLQLGVNYRPANRSSNEAVDLALSKQFLNNKITVDGNFGVNSYQTKNTSSLIGDVNVDYKISTDGRYRLKAFNRSNDITQITTAGGPYTQGVGVFYREEFETFNQLLRRYFSKNNKPAPQKK